MKKVDVPEGVSGDWAVKKFTISEKEAHFSMFSYDSRAPRPGEYTKLTHKGEGVVMSDTDAEMRDHRDAVRNARGHILINGLGIGMVLLNCLEKPEVEKATVVELSHDVIKLVGPHYEKKYADKLEIIQGDAVTWKPPKGIRYGMVWHDIWTPISSDNYGQMKTLHRRYGRRCDWQGSWCRWQVERLVKEENEERRIREMFSFRRKITQAEKAEVAECL